MSDITTAAASSAPSAGKTRVIGLKFYHSLFGFTARRFFVEYGDSSTPSHGWWIIPGEAELIDSGRVASATHQHSQPAARPPRQHPHQHHRPRPRLPHRPR